MQACDALCEMSIHEIVLPDDEYEYEWILGRAVPRLGGTYTHGVLQAAFGIALRKWEDGQGESGISWRFRIAPPGEIRRPLVPDVSFVSKERLRGLEGHDLDYPPFAPDVAVEIVSPEDPQDDLNHKIAVYLAGGATLVVVVDIASRSIGMHDRDGVRVLRGNDVLTHAVLPGFTLSLPEFFAEADRHPV